jgi:hypothetical protein
MPLNDAVMPLINDVVRLSYRIQEWWEVENYLRGVEGSFDSFYETLQDVDRENFGEQHSTLNSHWHICNHFYVTPLHTHVQHLKYIHEPPEPGNDNYPNPREGVEELVKIGSSIEQSLDEIRLEDLKKHTQEFQHALYGQITNRQDMMKYEVNLLCQVSFWLQKRVTSDT